MQSCRHTFYNKSYFFLISDPNSVLVSVNSQMTGAPAPPYMFAINGVSLDSQLPTSINDEGVHFLEIPGDKPPVYKADGSLDIAASYTSLMVNYL